MAPDVPPRGLTVRPLERADAEAIAAWRYEGPWDVYNSRPGDLLSAEAGYQAVADETGTLVGFVCLGQEARVPGLAEAEGTVDIGVGMRPDLVGQGLGRAFGAAVLAHVGPLVWRNPAAGGDPELEPAQPADGPGPGLPRGGEAPVRAGRQRGQLHRAGAARPAAAGAELTSQLPWGL